MGNVEWKFEGFDFAKIIVGELTNATEEELSAVITNRQEYAAILEYGSGVYSEFPGASKQRITAKSSKYLIVPIPSNKPGLEKWHDEAKAMAARYPDIMNRLKAKYSGVGLVGFLFRHSIAGMKPQRMVRGTVDKPKAVLEAEMAIAPFETRPRQSIANAINLAAAEWLREIVKKTPVLRSNLKTGWDISKLAR